jgi:NAD(P)H-hydrate repair Nnr-like enzyme with NAD(P)H-hydrate epimerase domain
VPSHQYDILERMGVPVVDEPGYVDVVIDALIGYRPRGAPRGRIGELVGGIGDVGDHVVALDTPSGLNVSDGSAPGRAVNADATITLACPRSAYAAQLMSGSCTWPTGCSSRTDTRMSPDDARPIQCEYSNRH